MILSTAQSSAERENIEEQRSAAAGLLCTTLSLCEVVGSIQCLESSKVGARPPPRYVICASYTNTLRRQLYKYGGYIHVSI